MEPGNRCCFPYVPHPRSENLTLVEPLLIFTESWGLLEILRKAFKMISLKKKKKCWEIDEGVLLAKFSYGLFLMYVF